MQAYSWHYIELPSTVQLDVNMQEHSSQLVQYEGYLKRQVPNSGVFPLNTDLSNKCLALAYLC